MAISKALTRSIPPRRINPRSNNSIDWQSFANPNSDDYRNVVLLQVASSAWATVDTYSEPAFYYQMAIAGYRAIFEWVCENVPGSYISGVDSRKETAAELASEFLRFVLPSAAVEYAEDSLMAYLTAYQCGPIGQFR